MQDNSLTDGGNQKHEMRLTRIYFNNGLIVFSFIEYRFFFPQ